MSLNKELIKRINEIENRQIKEVVSFLLEEVSKGTTDNNIKSALKTKMHKEYLEEE